MKVGWRGRRSGSSSVLLAAHRFGSPSQADGPSQFTFSFAVLDARPRHSQEGTSLGSVLLGAAVGDTVVLRVPGMAPQPFVIQAIRRSGALLKRMVGGVVEPAVTANG